MSRIQDQKNAKQEELEKLTKLFDRAWRKAQSDDENAMQGIDRCLDLMKRKAAVEASSQGGGQVASSYEKTIRALKAKGGLEDIDASLIALGRQTARQIDNMVLYGRPEDVTKALYLGPHLVNVLTKLGATPEARGIVKDTVTKAGKDGVASLTAWKKKHQTAG